MKKKKILTILFVLTLSFCVISCGKSESSQEVIGSVKTNMDECASMDFDLHAVSDINTKYNDTKISQKTEYSLNIKENIANAYITGDITTSIGGKNNKYPIEAYQTSANENHSLYFKEDDKWYRQDTEPKKGFGMQMLKMFYDSGMTFSEETKVVNEKECYVLSADVYGENATEFAKLFNIETSEDGKIGATVYIYKDLNYPAYIKVDLKQSAKQAIKNDELDIVINDLYIELTFNSFNETDVSVPEDIRKDAEKKTEESQTIQEQETIKPAEKEETEAPEPVTEEPSTEQFFDEDPEEAISELSNDWNSFQFEYDGVIYRMPMAYKSFELSGFIVKEEEKSTILESEQEYTTTLYKESYSVIAKIKNTSTTPKTLYECDIISLDFDGYSLDADQLAKFMFPNNVNFAALYDNLIEKWGEPTNMHDGTALKIATYQDGDNKVEIFFEPETNEMIEYKITAN